MSHTFFKNRDRLNLREIIQRLQLGVLLEEDPTFEPVG
jgi:hypothetical protein